MDKALTVAVPIRYGRRSRIRGNTYSSIVFDPSAEPGQAKLVPCTNSAQTNTDVIKEAIEMWTAERNGDNDDKAISASWGCVGMLAHPSRKRNGEIPAELFEYWASRVDRESFHYQHRNSVDTSGQLLLDWPKQVQGQELDFDLILAAVNFADVRIPTEHDIAKAYWDDHLSHLDYFIKNRDSGIRTAYDQRILTELAKLLTQS